ncbi:MULTISPECIES: hypothetical protein [Siminovitchia]|uniref:Uncharacterized protein n=1 Tax=Siminovitchia sediminis TaxID=1274353 RepID=A0ABW4KLN1_9BACI|nr:hypothetical protein [Siminovitchia fortis]
MNYKVINKLVRYDGKIWMIDAISDKGMATIFSNGQVAIAPEKELEYLKEIDA